ncbi:gluconate 2-dehydrogenase subunit 3 family protein [Mycobacterium sp. DBP42]|uniref:gluconate 2-dehydrogenase subunit 3 family protein n=1 Tax=Mycobacterium sp. DBP42 TaxID=2545267 RepID=UPI00110C9080|nr:gluconate 2-dehydrogenase subunit 3 family protein [Mycobacterium sp. DBP42]TMS52264.1 gluconate 2-dehydrogenase subunit 3 family protein [Mycobacterium sp. DBP42]
MRFRAPGQQGITPHGRGRFAGFDVLARADQWDQVTAGAVLARLTLPAGLSFFTPAEVAVASPMLDLMLAQDSEPRVPVLALIDERLATFETDGWHYDDMPEDGQAWRDSLAGLDADAHAHYGHGYAELDERRQARLLQHVQDLAGRGDDWHGVTAGRVWGLWTRYACTAFYSHPWAWNEMGFPGPAYPRGYLNPGINARESFEVGDQRAAAPVPFARRVERARRHDDDLPEKDTDG